MLLLFCYTVHCPAGTAQQYTLSLVPELPTNYSGIRTESYELTHTHMM